MRQRYKNMKQPKSPQSHRLAAMVFDGTANVRFGELRYGIISTGGYLKRAGVATGPYPPKQSRHSSWQ